MSAPNIVNVSTITGKTAVQAVSPSATAIVSNLAASGKVYKVNSLLVSNVDGINTAEITIDLYRSSTAYHLIKTASITAGSTLDLLAKTIYLEEGDSIRLTGSASSDLEAVCSYEEIDSTSSGAAGIFSTLTATGNTELGDAEATDTHAIKGATTLLANSSSDALRITQTGTGNALVVEDSANPDSTPFVVDASGKVGVGTSSPAANLDVNGFMLLSGVNRALRFEKYDGTTDNVIYYDNSITTNPLYIGRDSEALSFRTVNAQRMLIDSSGNVGIGTSSPDAKLHVVGATNSQYMEVGGPNRTLNFSCFATSADNAGHLINVDSTAGVLAFGTNNTERMRIDSSGNVGIGTTPSADLHVASNSPTVLLEDLDNAYSHRIIGSGATLYLDADTETASGSVGTIRFRVGGSSEKMRINSSGYVGIGVTSPSYQLELSTDSAGKPSTNTWTVVSDERIKENIELADLDLCYEAVKNIPLKRFKWRDDVYSEEQVADRHKIGWIAQDVESVYPKAVNIHEFKYNQVYNETIIPAVEEELDEDGNVITEAQEERTEKELVSEDVIEDCRNLNADQIYAAMFGAIQKLIQKVETLETRIAQLEA